MESSIPSGEEEPGRGWVGRRDARQRAAELCKVSARIQEHVRQRVTHLSRRAQDVKVVAVRERAPAKTKDSVHSSRNACGNGFHSAGEVALARSLCNQVHVVVLDRVVREPEAPTVARRSEAALELSNQLDSAQ